VISALEFLYDNALYKSTFYLFTYLLTVNVVIFCHCNRFVSEVQLLPIWRPWKKLSVEPKTNDSVQNCVLSVSKMSVSSELQYTEACIIVCLSINLLVILDPFIRKLVSCRGSVHNILIHKNETVLRKRWINLLLIIVDPYSFIVLFCVIFTFRFFCVKRTIIRNRATVIGSRARCMEMRYN